MSKFLDDFIAEIATREKANVFFIGEYKDGVIETRQLQRTNPCQDTYSVSKAFVVTAIGMLVDRGLLRTDEILTDILADELPETYNEVWTKTTVHMLLLHKVYALTDVEDEPVSPVCRIRVRSLAKSLSIGIVTTLPPS